jgi:NADPH:quinone reductase-like Zn-dependent oxidoreductase
MKAIAYNRYGGPEVMELTEVPVPEVPPGYGLVKIHAASINPVDWKLRSGMLKFITGRKFPRIMGADLSGTLTEVNGDGAGLKVGDAVCGFAQPTQPPGSLAEYCVVALNRLAHVPPELSMTEAAALPLVCVTAHTALFKVGDLRAGQKLLVVGAAGGVGHVAVQMAKAHGAEVTATCRTNAVDFVTGLGADVVIDYTAQDILECGEAFDLILDASGKLPFLKAKRIMKPRGIFLDPDLKFLNLFFGLFGKRYKPVLADVLRTEIEKFLPMLAAGTLRSVVGEVFKFADAIPAITAIEGGQSIRGKAVFVV